MTAPTPSATAYSYIRFSTPEQAKGDSLRRQTDAAAAWSLANGVPLDTTLTLRDLGKSAFTGKHRKNPDTHALAAFLKLAEQGRVPRGSYLIIENLDRLSRENERDALRLWMDILDLGINIVQLSPETVFRHEKSDMVDIIRAIIELSRGHSESKIKSERVGKAWQQKKRRAREGEESVITKMLPAWVEEKDGKLVLIPDRAAIVHRIFTLAISGLGYGGISKVLYREKLPAFGYSGKWNVRYIANILNDRRAVGEYQPRNKADDTPDGEPIPNYFPPVVTEDEFAASRRPLADKGKTRVGKHVNLFSGMITNARDGEPYFAESKPARVLISAGSKAGRAPPHSFPIPVFEQAVLSLLKEIDPHEILNGDTGPDATIAIAAELARVEGELLEASSFMDENGFSPTIGKRVQGLEERKRVLGEQLAEARRKAAHPQSEAWGEAQSLAGVLANASDPREVRERLRTVLRQVVRNILLLVVPQGRDRLAAVQVHFTGERGGRSYRTVHVLYRPGGTNPGGFYAESFRGVRDFRADLRTPEGVAFMTAELPRLLPWELPYEQWGQPVVSSWSAKGLLT